MKMLRTLIMAIACAGVTMAFAGNGVDASTISYKDWAGAKPKVVIVLPRAQTNKEWLMGGWGGDFLWEGSDELSQLGTSLYRRNNFAPGDSAKKNRYYARVKEVYLGEPEGLLKVLRPGNSGMGSNRRWVSAEDLRDVPFGAKRVIYVSIWKPSLPDGVEAIVVAFDPISDDDLRRITFDDAVLRLLRHRED